MRVGFWWFLDALTSRGLRASLAINGSACRVYEDACAAALQAGREFMGHGFIQRPMHHLEDEAGAIAETISAIRDFTGKAPRGWESPGLTETADTLDLLAAAGIEYVCDWCLDDQPVPLKATSGNIISIPYSVEINDVVISAVQLHRSDEIFVRGRDHFDRLYQEGAAAPRVMAITIHHYLTGVPHRIKYIEDISEPILGHADVVMWTGDKVLAWYIDRKSVV